MAKVIITRNRPYDLTVDIKQPDSPTSAELPIDAVATFYVIDKDTNTALITKEMTRLDTDPSDPENDPNSSRFRVDLTAEETALLPYEFEYKEDGMKPRDVCRAHITVDNPNATGEEIKYADALIPSVYVTDLGI
jgi:hypothetical protein